MCVKRRDLELMTTFVNLVQLQAFWEWVIEKKEMWCVIWLGQPFQDWTLAAKSLKDVMVTHENLDMHYGVISYILRSTKNNMIRIHFYTIFNVLDTFTMNMSQKLKFCKNYLSPFILNILLLSLKEESLQFF
jgi:hypothetical protein